MFEVYVYKDKDEIPPFPSNPSKDDKPFSTINTGLIVMYFVSIDIQVFVFF